MSRDGPVPRFAEAVPPPDAVLLGGPLLFELGLLALLVRAVVRRVLPAWGPVLVLAGFVAIAVNLNLLPVGAALVFGGLLPLRTGAAGRVTAGSVRRRRPGGGCRRGPRTPRAACRSG
ncbi:hypothetical protein Q2K19_05535 [Micromonospora soli]|uniref:hypothetical protein n=1 Tax=Micromonospora sp. NBRC 110009 TaxID=3061627 RepID=UPI0026718AB9|nr:hypothetical protein [Micromonospora sp. NBRC 110009]WKT99951.1 hypothetical protein Q2K19_05535 [Micromonospora sp. NBRC 110009]